MNQSPKIRSLFFFAVLGMLTLTAQAGGMLRAFMPQDGNLSTNRDDLAVAKTLKWYPGAEVQFFYDSVNGQILNPALNLLGNDLSTNQVTQALSRAIGTWNDARFGGQPIVDLLIDAKDSGYRNLGFPMTGATLDGLSVISFLETDPFIDDSDEVVALNMTSFFLRDFNLDDLEAGDSGWSVVIPDNAQDTAAIPFGGYFISDPDGDDKIEIWLPLNRGNYEQGDIFEQDIVFNLDQTQFFQAWPEDRSDIPAGQQADVLGSLDVQMLMTHYLGYSQGIADSGIIDSVMYPYFDSIDTSYPSDPYRRRNLSFDDEMTAGMAIGSFPANTGAISGSVIEGSIIAGQGLDFANGEEASELDFLDEYVTQVPVFLCVRPDQLAEASGIRGEGYDVYTDIDHPDDINPQPQIQDENQGKWRRIAQVLTGDEVVLQAGSGFDFSFDVEDDGSASENGNDGTQAGNNPDFEDTDLFPTTLEKINSSYTIPGLAEMDDNGTPIKYAVLLDQSDYILNPVQSEMNLLTAELYPSEFYGGPGAQLQVGLGTTPDANIINDTAFENNFVTVAFNAEGRFSAAINDGPAFLSGYPNDPHSYVVVNSKSGSSTNHFGPIAALDSALQIDDIQNKAEGIWRKANDFRLRTTWEISDLGGSGLPAGVKVSHLLTNLDSAPQTITFRQVLDTFLFSRENPLYTVDDVQVSQEKAYTGSSVPEEVHFQTSLNSPALSSFINLRATGLDTPDKVLIARLENIGKGTVSGGALTGADQSSLDSGVALEWTFTLAPGESKSMRYIVGFMTPGRFIDTWIPWQGVSLDPDEDPGDPADQIYGFEDDPAKIEPVYVTAGQVTDGIDIITNTGQFIEGITPLPVPDGSVSASFLFVRTAEGFPSQPDNITSSGAVGDIDNDGDLDVVTGRFGGGADPLLSSMNRVYVNQQRVRKNGAVSYYYNDETFGPDGIPGSSDDRLRPPTNPEVTLGVVLADFNGDGWLDIFFSNRGPSPYTQGDEFLGPGAPFPGRYFATNGAPCRLYINRGEEKPGYFTDVSADVLPGLLNRGWNSPVGGNGNPSKAQAVDVDSDGDLDIVISQEVPITDEIVESPSFALLRSATTGFVDAYRTDDFPAGDGLTDSANDLFTETLYVCEQVLINQINSPPYSPELRRFQFVDETLGADDRVGTLTSLELAETIDGPAFNDFGQSITFYDPAELDRMPPLLPRMVYLAARTLDEQGVEIAGLIPSPMSGYAVEPHFGQIGDNGAAGFYSVRSTLRGGPDDAAFPFHSFLPGSRTGEGETEPPVVNDISPVEVFGTGVLTVAYGRDQAFFTNCDIFSNFDGSLTSDGVPDGYFSCFNYDNDYGSEGGFLTSEPQNSPRMGLFAAVPVSTTNIETTSTALLYDAMPLFIGLPEGNPGSITPDIVPQVDSGAWTGELADFEYRGQSRPLIMADNDPDNGLPYYFRSNLNSFFTGNGVYRGQTGLVTGASNVYNSTFFADPYAGNYIAGPEWDQLLLPAPPGEPYGMTIGDFDRDGDIDAFVGTATLTGIAQVDASGFYTFILNGTPTANQLLANDSFADFTDISQIVIPNSPAITLDTIAADYDNDGDLDLINFNALTDNEIYVNQLFTKAPDLNDDADPTMFYESTITTLAPIYGKSVTPPYIDSGQGSGQSYNTVVADLNNDKRMDLLIAEGGSFSEFGDSVQLLLNVGIPALEGLKQFKPVGASYPAPLLRSEAGIPGFIVDQGFNKDVTVGDVDNDGDLDIFIARPPANDTDSSRLLINIDVDDVLYNTAPDPDSIGDGIFLDTYDGQTTASLPILSDPNGAPGSLVLKAQAQRALMADVNKDGAIDIIIANGFSGDIGGAPNVLLLNDPDLPGNFIDATETNFPIIGNEGVMDNTQNLSVGDFDDDGDIDIAFFNQSNVGSPYGSRLLINRGNGKFDEAAAGAIPALLNRKPRGVVTADFDKDGLLDIFVAMENDFPVLLINNPLAPGTFVDQSSLRFGGDYAAFNARGADVGDIDLDGDLDIIVAESRGGVTRHARIYQNVVGSAPGGEKSAGFFKDISYEMPFARGTRGFGEDENNVTNQSLTGWANDVDLIDIDNDGDLDVIISCAGNPNAVPAVGSLNIAYTNRIVGANLNFKQNNLNQTPGNPVVFVVNPPAAARGKTTRVSVMGQNFEADTLLSFGDGVQVSNMIYVNSGKLIVDLIVSPTARLGARAVTIENPRGGQSQTKNGAFTVYDGLADAHDSAVKDKTWLLMQ